MHVLSKELRHARSFENLRARGLGVAYLPCDARAKVFDGLWPGASMTPESLAEALAQLDKHLVVDDYGSVECVKFAREEYNKRWLAAN